MRDLIFRKMHGMCHLGGGRPKNYDFVSRSGYSQGVWMNCDYRMTNTVYFSENCPIRLPPLRTARGTLDPEAVVQNTRPYVVQRLYLQTQLLGPSEMSHDS